jgi:hypothetical protein
MITKLRRIGVAYSVVLVLAVLALAPPIISLIEGDVFYALVVWPSMILIFATAINAGRRVYADAEFFLRRKFIGWRQGPGTTRMLVMARRRLHPAWYVAGILSYPAAVAFNATRNLDDGGWWPQFAGVTTAAVLLLLSHWEYKARRDEGQRLYQAELDRRAGR